ncbi:MAG: alpha-glucosidase [Oscillospiraceae bacterium]|nr:alpha-glucosidase [Oscillospiraceae bacterium]
MIRKYSYGIPFETDAVVQPVPLSEGAPQFVTVSHDPLTFTCKLADSDVVYGLGQNVRGINKRGWEYTSSCSDEPNHHEDKRSLYASHNFVIVSGENTLFGLFLDEPGKVTFDVGYTRWDTLTITAHDSKGVLYEISGETEADIVKQFRQLIGKSYLPPKWAFGYGQSRWSYMTADEVREVAKGYREKGMALDSIYLDIDYMERYKDFTVDSKAFPDLAGLSAELKEQGIHLVPIIDAGVKIEEGYDVYEEGVEKGYFCKEADGKEFVAAVWPGLVHFTDVLNPDARKWFGDKYKVLVDMGIDGFWNDMNEPSIFYSEKRLEEFFAAAAEARGKNLDIHHFQQLQEQFAGLANSYDDYRSFYHKLADGTTISHDQVHNLYGYNMTRAAGESLEAMSPDKRILLYSRSSYPGMHRYGGIWQGDNKSWWSHIAMNVKMTTNLNMMGLLYTGADIGGFTCDCTEDLLLRWMAFGVFTPLMRNHSAMGTRRQELYAYPHAETFKDLISVRYMILPYIYSEFMKAALRDEMMFRPLSFDYREDERVREIEDQVLVGDSIMLAPVLQQNTTRRYVYLPEEMKLVRMKAAGQWTEEILPAGDHCIKVELDEIPMFIRPNKIVPIAKNVGASVAATDFENLSVLSFVKDEAEYELYDDDGYTRTCDVAEHYTQIKLDAQGNVTVKGSKSVTL